MISKKNINNVLKGVIAAMPAIPYVMKSRQRTSIAAYVLGGLGLAVAGGLLALMFFSPRTRHRALNAAKGTYGKVNERISHLRHTDEGGPTRADAMPVSNGLSGRDDYGSTTGL